MGFTRVVLNRVTVDAMEALRAKPPCPPDRAAATFETRARRLRMIDRSLGVAVLQAN